MPFYSLETLSDLGRLCEANKIDGFEARYAYVMANYIKVENDLEELRTIFTDAFPNDNYIIPEEQVEARKKVSDNARDIYARIGVEDAGRVHIPDIPRHMVPMRRPDTPENKEYNDELARAVKERDNAALGRLFEEHFQNLPSYDPEDLLALSDEELPGVFHDLYPLYVAVQEANNLLISGKAEDKAVLAQLSDATKELMGHLTRDMDVFTAMKTRFDAIANPHYAYLDTDRLLRTPGTSNTLSDLSSNLDTYSQEAETEGLSRTLTSLASSNGFYCNGYGRHVELRLEGEGFDLSKAKFRDPHNRECSILSAMNGYFSKDVFNKDEVLYCTEGQKLKTFAVRGGKLTELDPADALEEATVKATAAMKKTDSLLNSSVADPFWMLTGSSQYRAMKKNLADYKKAVNGRCGEAELTTPAAMVALENLATSAKDYFKYKDVDLKEHPDFLQFRRHPKYGEMSERELARMEAAYSVLEFARDTLGTVSLRQDVSRLPALSGPQMINGAMPLFGKEEGPSRAEVVAEQNERLRKSDFLTAPVEEKEGNEVGEMLRGELNEGLFGKGKEKGLLDKKLFTAEDRQLAETLLAKAVVLNMIRAGRKTDNPPVPTEQAYKANGEELLNQVKASDAFRKAAGERLSPAGLRNFLLDSRQSSVSKEVLTGSLDVKSKKERTAEATNLLDKTKERFAVPPAPVSENGGALGMLYQATQKGLENLTNHIAANGDVFTTKKQREAAEDLLAMAVTLDSMRDGREKGPDGSDPAKDAKEAYASDPKAFLKNVKSQPAFMEGLKTIASPLGLFRLIAGPNCTSLSDRILGRDTKIFERGEDGKLKVPQEFEKKAEQIAMKKANKDAAVKTTG